eukprot:15464782-Alexandrium_andersonii.AAC.1
MTLVLAAEPAAEPPKASWSAGPPPPPPISWSALAKSAAEGRARTEGATGHAAAAKSGGRRDVSPCRVMDIAVSIA